MTSIELLFNKLWEEPKDKLTWNSILEEAKEMHKKEIINSFNDGRKWNNSWVGETYYKELYENPNTLGR
jgi:hypothetical protein